MTVPVITHDAGVIAEIAGRPVALKYTSVEAEYASLRRSAMLVDRSHRTRMTFEGDRRLETLTGLVTNDVGSLAPGMGQYAAALTPRGKIISDIRVFARERDLLIDVPTRASAGWSAMVRKFVNPRSTKYADVTETLVEIGVFGVRASEIVAGVSGLTIDAVSSLPMYGSVAGKGDAAALLVARVPDLGVDGYELFVAADSRAAVWQKAVDLGAVPAGLEAWEIARIEAGRPEWGIDIDESTIPQEANFDELHAISYTKGCYTGQETVARVHFRGHVNRHLRGLTYAGDTVLPTGAQLLDDAEKVVGDVRSSAVSPRLGGVALGMVRREIAPESTVRVKWEGNETVATVAVLPFDL
ncbi:MAG TPA: glycine cleavage T C-terminal barrel domain-containing protein [Gemmatimonadaceae bacterium]|nr:glycine cleavage T C-terminal barrel domain-containing protein [Gemmatimonadaceae bacterium]